VNLKIIEVEKRTKELLVRERTLLITSDDIKAKSKELIKWENEIIDKEKDSAVKAKTLLEKENALREKEKAINEKEKSINRADQERLSRETELNERLSQLLAKEKLQQEDYEKLLAAKSKLLEKETSILSREKILEEGGMLETIEPASTDIKGLDIERVAEDLEIKEETGSYPESGPEEEPSVEPPPQPEVSQETEAAETEPESQPENEAADEGTEGERACPRCGTMISKVATTCFACGTDLVPEISPPEVQPSPEEEGGKETPAESEFLEFEKKERGGEVQIPTKEELYTLSEEQLVSVSSALGLDTSGRVKHLRERLIEFIEKTEEEQLPGVADEPKEKDKQDTKEAPTCTDCGSQMNYIEQYNRYYCYSCEKYAKRS